MTADEEVTMHIANAQSHLQKATVDLRKSYSKLPTTEEADATFEKLMNVQNFLGNIIELLDHCPKTGV